MSDTPAETSTVRNTGGAFPSWSLTASCKTPASPAGDTGPGNGSASSRPATDCRTPKAMRPMAVNRRPAPATEAPPETAILRIPRSMTTVGTTVPQEAPTSIRRREPIKWMSEKIPHRPRLSSAGSPATRACSDGRSSRSQHRQCSAREKYAGNEYLPCTKAPATSSHRLERGGPTKCREERRNCAFALGVRNCDHFNFDSASSTCLTNVESLASIASFRARSKSSFAFFVKPCFTAAMPRPK